MPTVARTVPELTRPLKNWGAQWLVREILAAREQRLPGHRVEVLREHGFRPSFRLARRAGMLTAMLRGRYIISDGALVSSPRSSFECGRAREVPAGAHLAAAIALLLRARA